MRVSAAVFTSFSRDCQARLAPLLQEAAVETQQELPAAIARSDERRQALQQIETLEREIVADGDGLALPQLVEEAAGVDRDTIAPLLAELEHQANELAARREQAGAAITSADAQLAGMQGHDAALRAAEEREDALATMGDAAERWVTLTVGTRLLRAALDLYRERQQDPLLQRAGTIFRTLTLEEFASLRIDHEGERPSLVGVRRNEETVPIDGLSTGTRDQLFLALRIAAVEQYLDAAPGLPFVADDLFINFDDRRAAAGFEVLQRLAARTQVLFFTHHSHLGEIARKATGGGAAVLEI